MAKTRRAATEYKRGKWHLARILEARWASLPGVGPDAPTILVLQIKLTVPYYWEAQPGTNLDANTPLEIVGSEAVVYVPCTKDRAPLTDEGDCFLHELGVRREATSDPLEHTDAWFKYEFGPIDPIYGYQSIIDWGPTIPAPVTAVPQTITGQKRPAFDLDLSQEGIAVRNGVTLDFSDCPIAWHVLECLALRHPLRYPTKDLKIDAWVRAGRRAPRGATKPSFYSAISQLRRILRKSQCSLDLPHATSRGYLLLELKEEKEEEEV